MKRFLKKYWLRLTVLTTAIVLTVSLLLAILLSGNLSIELTEENGLNLKAYYLSSKSFSSSVIMDLKEYDLGMTIDFDDGKKVFGGEYTKVKAGKFSNEMLGDYMLYRYTAVKSVIILSSKNGKYAIVFNLKTESETESFYNQLESIMI